MSARSCKCPETDAALNRGDARNGHSELRVYAKSKNGNRTAIPVIGWINNILIVRGNGEMLDDAHRIERLDDLLPAGARQLPVADQDAETAGREIGAGSIRDTVDGNGKPDTVVGPVPSTAFENQTGRRGPVDVGEFVRFLAAVVDAEAREHTEVGWDLLLEIQGQS